MTGDSISDSVSNTFISPGIKTGFIVLPPSAVISFDCMFKPVLPACFPVIVIFPSKTLVSVELITFPPSRPFIQTELEGTKECSGIVFQSGNETAVISAISGSETEIVMLKPDSPAGTSSITISTFWERPMSISTV